MNYWRITKYNPEFRDEDGRYLLDEWISFGDIGRTYEGKELTFSAYLETENAYISSVEAIMSELGVHHLRIEGLEINRYKETYEFQDKEKKKFYNSLHNGMELDREEIMLFMRIVLREMAWARLTRNDMFVHFGYDYYMYVGTAKPIDKSKRIIQESGLFIEEFESPYLHTDDE